MIAEDARMRKVMIVGRGYFLYAHFALAQKRYKIYTAVSASSPNNRYDILADEKLYI